VTFDSFVRLISGRGIRLGLDRMRLAWDWVVSEASISGTDPTIILIGGTNGKGTTAKRLESSLRVHGRRTFLYTSPHLIRVEERYRFDGVRVESSALECAHQACLEAFPDGQTSAGVLTPFEWMTVVGFYLASRSDADVWILEVGLGGRFDATNVVEPHLSVITSVERDHMDRLGDSLEEIAREKAGILRPARPAILGPRAAKYIRHPGAIVSGQQLRGAGSAGRYDYDGPAGSLQFELPSEYGPGQDESLALAIAATDVIQDATPEARLRGAQAAAKATWPGRFQVVREDPLLIIDGGHNVSGLKWLVAGLRTRFPGQRFHVVFGVRPDKEIAAMVQVLRDVATSWSLQRDEERLLAAPSTYVEDVFGHNTSDVHVSTQSVRNTVAAQSGPVLVTGSLYLCGELLKKMGFDESLGKLH